MNGLIEFTLRNRLLILVLGLFILVGGIVSYRHLPVDAFPDVTPTLVQVFVETEGLAPEEVEKYVTYPLEAALNGLPDLKEIRSVSNFGLSVVNVYFEDGTDIYFARQLVNERLQEAREAIPPGFGEPVMGPITTGLGQILFYFVEDESGKRSPQEMREIQDWIIKYNLQTVPGVTEVLSLGGEVKQFQVEVRPADLLRYNLNLHDVVEAVRDNNANVGAQFIVKNSERYIVRSVGLARGISDLEGIVLKTVHGTPVHLRQVADVVIGGAPRHGLATMDGRGETVAGMVLKLIGTNTSSVISDVRDRLANINRMLPPGVRAVPYYDQAALVNRCIDTVSDALFQGIGLVILVLFVFMGGWRPSVVVAVSIPFSVFFAFILMNLLGISANLMSLGGLAIAIGMMVDGTIVMVENVDRMLHLDDSDSSRLRIIARACTEVGRPVVFAIAIIIIVFLPLFTLQGVEGKTFKPLAETLVLAMLGSLIFAILMAPVGAALLMRRNRRGNLNRGRRDTLIVRILMRPYRPVVAFFVRHRITAILLALIMLGAGVAVVPRLGSEFVPRLHEGDLLVRATMAPSISLDAARDTMLRFERRLISRFPEVTRVVTRVGRGEIGAHADPVNSAEAFVALKSRDQWQTAGTPEELYARMSHAFEDFPGVRFNFTQPIAAAVDELITGTKADLAVKIFGPDMEVLRTAAAGIESTMHEIRGASEIQQDQVTGTPQVRVTLDHDALSRYGISVEAVQHLLSAAVGGEAAGQVLEDVRRFDIIVRYTAGSRQTVDAIREIIVPSPGGARVPLSELARVEEIVGPRQITRENSQRFIAVQCNVRGRDMGSFVREAQQRVAAAVTLPPGYYISWGGQFELQEEANRRLAVVVPLTLLVVFVLLFGHFRSLGNTLLIILNIPLALVGGVLALWLSGQNLSVPASVGFIALFGIALENAMVLINCLNQLREDGLPMAEVCVRGACMRLRPVLMTAATTALGLIPLLLASGTGSEVQRPLATVVVGGLATSTVLTLFVIPALYAWFAGGRKTVSVPAGDESVAG